MEALGDRPLDFRAMWAISNLFRSAAADPAAHGGEGPAPTEHLSWTSFVGLWVLWVWGEMETPTTFAAAVGISRPDRDRRRHDARGPEDGSRRKTDPNDGRMVLVSLTAAGTRRTIEQLFPRFNAEEVEVTSHSTGAQDALGRADALDVPRRRTERRAFSRRTSERHADRHPLDAVHEVGADPLDRSGELDRRDPG